MQTDGTGAASAINLSAPGWSPLSQVTARRVQDLIVSGAWKAGEKIPSQRVLAEQFNISRASLREALLTLETLGLIKTEPGRGTFVTYGTSVREPNASKWRYEANYALGDVFETRMMLEGQIAGAAATRIDAPRIAELMAATDEMERFWTLGDLLANVDADLRFHQVIVQCCGNRMLRALYAEFFGMLTETQRQPIPRTQTARMSESLSEHRCIIDALSRADAEAARRAMQAHVRNTAFCAGLTI